LHVELYSTGRADANQRNVERGDFAEHAAADRDDDHANQLAMLRVRAVQESDRELLLAAAKADPYHAAAGISGERWTGPDSIFYEDEDGPVVALRTTNVVRVDIQFLTQDRVRNSQALMAGFYAYVNILLKRGVKEVVFNTESPEVAHFFMKRFHFKEVSRGTYSLRIN
jgi:hypothetical protein